VENARPLNVGQLKHVASQARTYLDNVLQPWGGAGTAITTLISQFQGKSTNPLTPVAERAENAAPVNVGQLKQVAELFYGRLAEMGLDAGTETATRLGGTASPRPGKSYMVPWRNDLPATENNSIATIGQLKMAFGFKVDVDLDGVLDALEWYLINASSADELVSLADIHASAVTADADGDGLTAAQEFTAHTSWISPDTDNDGMLDGWELGNQLNPLADDAGEDSDLDQLTNVEEYQMSSQTGQAFNPRSSHSFGPEWTDYEQSLLQTWGQSPAAVAAQRGSDQNVLRAAPLYRQYRRGISYWIAQHLIETGPQALESGWQPFVGTALLWLGKPDEGDFQQDIQIAPSSGFADREGALPVWPGEPGGLPESALLNFGNGLSGRATASGVTADLREYAGQETPENLIYSYENLGGKLDQLRVWLSLPQKVDFPVTRSFYVLKRTRYAATTPDMVELPSAVLNSLTMHTLTVPPALLAAGSAAGNTTPLPASSESLPVDVASASDAVSKARVRHLSTAHPFRFVFRAYPQGLLQESGGAPVSAETEPIAYLPVRVNENREQAEGSAALGIEPTFEPMPDIDHNRASVASTGFLSGEALSYDRDFIKLEFDAGNIPDDEISVEVHTSVAPGTKLFLYDDEGRAISQEELQATALQPIAPIWGKLISGKVYAEIGRLNTAASSPVPGSPVLPPAGAATITVEARFHNPQAPLNAGQPAAPTILSKAITLILVEVVDLAPKLKDETGTEIADSNKPVALPKANGMVEEDAANNRIAHRELKVSIGSALQDKKVTWSMEANFTPTGASQPRFRGDWATAAEAHRDRFEASTTYGPNAYRAVSQEQGETTVDANGFTAIRVNVPPWGLNKARIKIQIEGSTTPINLIDLEVPGVIVIDPGHGIGAAGSSKAIGGQGDFTSALEHEFAFDIGTRMATDLRRRRGAKGLPLKIYLTRAGTGNLSFPDRTRVARENGCDVYVSIHFNDVFGVPLRRHPFGMWDSTHNHNLAEDQALAIRLRGAVQGAIESVEPKESRNAATDGITSATHETNLQKGLDTCSDSTNNTTPNFNGNIPGHTPCRAALIELEWMSNNRADLLFNEGNTALSATANNMREEAAQAMADAVIEDLYAQPAQ
jgi:N-acetylmuramoyl-L-alanine amidase